MQPEWLHLRRKISFILLGLILILALLSPLLGIKPNSSFLDFARELYTTHGYLVAFFGAYLEAILLVSLWLPAPFVVALGSAFSAQGVLNVWLFTTVAIAGFVAGHFTNYLLGKYAFRKLLLLFGLSREIQKTTNILSNTSLKQRIIIWAASFFHPSGGALVTTCYGILKLSFKEFLIISILLNVVWNTFWSAINYQFSELILSTLGSWYIWPIAAFLILLGMLTAGIKIDNSIKK